MNFKKNMSLILSSALIFATLASCGSSASLGYTLHDEMYYKHDNDDGIYEIAVVTKSSKSEYWNTVVQAMMDRADEFESVKVVEYSPENERDVNGQVTQFETAIAWESDAIVVAPISEDSTSASVVNSKNKRIPVVMMDTVASGKNHDAFVGPDYKVIGSEAGVQLAKDIGGTGKIFIVSNLEMSASEKQLVEAFVYEIEKNYPNITIMSTDYITGNKQVAFDLTREMISTYTDIKGVFTVSNEATMGVAECLEYLGVAKTVSLISYAFGQDIDAAIYADLIDLNYFANAYQLGVESFNTALAIIQGNELSDTNITIDYLKSK